MNFTGINRVNFTFSTISVTDKKAGLLNACILMQYKNCQKNLTASGRYENLFVRPIAYRAFGEFIDKILPNSSLQQWP